MKRYIENSWEGFQAMVMPNVTNPEQIADMRKSFFCGATALFNGIMHELSEGSDSTQGDEDFMADLDAELHEFGRQLDTEVLGPRATPGGLS